MILIGVAAPFFLVSNIVGPWVHQPVLRSRSRRTGLRRAVGASHTVDPRMGARVAGLHLHAHGGSSGYVFRPFCGMPQVKSTGAVLLVACFVCWWRCHRPKAEPDPILASLRYLPCRERFHATHATLHSGSKPPDVLSSMEKVTSPGVSPLSANNNSSTGGHFAATSSTASRSLVPVIRSKLS